MGSAAALLALLALQTPGTPTNLEVERAPNPTAVGDNSPDFRAVVTAAPANRYRLQVYQGTTLLWNRNWTPMPLTDPGQYCPEIAFAGGTPLQWNTFYQWRIAFANGTRRGPWSPYGTFTMASPNAVASDNGNGSPTQTSWRFVTVPIRAGTTVPASELLDDVPYLYRLDEPSRTWIPMNPGDTLTGGVGYLAWTAPGTILDLTQGSVATRTQQRSFSYTTWPNPVGQEITDGVAANTYRGNNLAGNPFNAPILWDNRSLGGHVARRNISAAYWKWDGTQYLTYNGRTRLGPAGPVIAPFQAFGVVALSTDNRLTLYEPPAVEAAPLGKPLPAAGTPVLGKAVLNAPAPATFTRNSWGLTLEVRSAGALDTDTIAGVEFEASEEWDERDTEDPGADTSRPWILASFEHPEWPVHPRNYTHDFRKTPVHAGEEVIWNLALAGNTKAAATVSWPNLSSIPADDWSFSLVDPQAGTTTDLSKASSLEVGPIDGKYPLILKARRLTEFCGALQASRASGGEPPPATVQGGTAGVTMLEILLSALEEPVVVDTFTVRHGGTGDPAQVSASLYEGSRRLAGPSSLAGGAAAWAGLNCRVNPEVPVLWRVVYDFGGAASGTYRAGVRTGEIGGTGVYSQKSLSPEETLLAGEEVTALPAEDGDRDPNDRCGLLGAEAWGVMVFGWWLRRRRADKSPRGGP